MEVRSAERDFAQWDDIAAEVVRLPVDAVVTGSSPWIRAVLVPYADGRNWMHDRFHARAGGEILVSGPKGAGPR